MYLPKGWEKCLTFTGKLFLGVVKGNWWDYGTIPYAKFLIEAEIDWLWLINIEDVLLLWKEKINLPILLLYEIPSGWIREALKNKSRLNICIRKFISLISDQAVKLGIKANIHIKTNTNLNRIGVSPKYGTSFLKYVSNLLDLLWKEC